MIFNLQLGGLGRAGGSAQVNDPNFASVKSLLHFNGTDASTTFTDVTGKTWTANGNAQIDTAQSKYGGASGLFDGTGDYLSAADSADWDFGTGDFTVEAFVRFNTHVATQALISNYLDATTGWTFQWNQTTSAFAFVNGNSALASRAWTPTDGVWYHLAACRSGTSLRLFVDGVQLGATATSSTNITGSTNPLLVGALFSGSYLQPFDGWLDEMRITKGVARYTAGFTPPSAAFPDS